MSRRNAIKPRPWPPLSEREAQVIAYTAEGQAQKLIAYQLGVSTTTVSNDLSRVAKKVGVCSRIDRVTAYRVRARPREDAAP